MHFGESLHIFIKYINTNETNTITFKNNILSFHKEELVKVWNNIFNNNIQWSSISRSFTNYKIKSVTPKGMENDIKQYKFPYHFNIDTILIRPPRTNNIKNSILRNTKEKKTFCIEKRVHFEDSLNEKIIIPENSSIIEDTNVNTEDKQILNMYDKIREELYNTYNYDHNHNYNNDHKYYEKYHDKQLLEYSFSKIPF